MHGHLRLRLVYSPLDFGSRSPFIREDRTVTVLLGSLSLRDAHIAFTIHEYRRVQVNLALRAVGSTKAADGGSVLKIAHIRQLAVDALSQFTSTVGHLLN